MLEVTHSDVNELVSASNCVACHRRLCALVPQDRRKAARKTIVLNRGDYLNDTGGSCLKLWSIVKGTAAVCTSLADGRKQVIGLEFPGDTACGLLAVSGANSWLEALSDCWICEIDLSEVSGNLKDDSKFMSQMFSIVHNRLEVYSTHIVTLGRLDGIERVTLFLAEIAHRIGKPLEDGILLTLPMSREDIADYLGLNTETVSRIFGRIKKSGLVTFISPTEILIPDLAALEARIPIATSRQRHLDEPEQSREELVKFGG